MRDNPNFDPFENEEMSDPIIQDEEMEEESCVNEDDEDVLNTLIRRTSQMENREDKEDKEDTTEQQSPSTPISIPEPIHEPEVESPVEDQNDDENEAT